MQYNARVRLTRRSEGDKVGNEKCSLSASLFGVSFILLSTFVVIVALLVNNYLPPPVGSQEGPVQNYRLDFISTFSSRVRAVLHEYYKSSFERSCLK